MCFLGSVVKLAWEFSSGHIRKAGLVIWNSQYRSRLGSEHGHVGWEGLPLKNVVERPSLVALGGAPVMPLSGYECCPLPPDLGRSLPTYPHHTLELLF